MGRLLKYLKPIWWKVALVIVLVAVDAYLGLLLPAYIATITTIMKNPNGYFTGDSPVTYLIQIFGINLFPTTKNSNTDTWIIGGFMTGVSCVAMMLSFFSSVMNSHVGAYFGRTIRREVFNKVTSLSMSGYTKFGTATLITRTTNDIEQCQQVVQMGLRILVRSPMCLMVAIIMILTTKPNLALILVFSLAVMIGTMVVLFVVSIPLFEKFQQSFDDVTSVMREGITGVRVVRAFNQEKREKKRFEDVSMYSTKLTVKFTRIMSIGMPVIGISFDITYLLIYYFGYKNAAGDGSYLYNQIQVGEVIAAGEYAMILMFSFVMFSMLLITIPRAQASAKRINEVLDTVNEIEDVEDPVTPNNKDGIVEFDNVSFVYPDSTLEALKGISFKTKPGSTTAIIGSTGSGKSTIINLIPRLQDVTSGQIKVDGVDIRKMSKKELRGRIGFVPQQALLFTGTIRSNMLMGNPDATEEEIMQALDVAQAAHFVAKKEHGIESEVTHGGKNYSGGQKQRLCIARALVKKPEIYIFDDSFSALDFKTDIKLRTALKEYTKKSSVIIVAQRVSTILDADNIIVLSDGEIVGQGKHDYLLKTCRVYQEIVFSQLDKDEIEKTINLAKETVAEGGEA